ncbi:hypothetical protein LguiA_003528 [Lonicera macranthoides]
MLCTTENMFIILSTCKICCLRPFFLFSAFNRFGEARSSISAYASCSGSRLLMYPF